MTLNAEDEHQDFGKAPIKITTTGTVFAYGTIEDRFWNSSFLIVWIEAWNSKFEMLRRVQLCHKSKIFRNCFIR